MTAKETNELLDAFESLIVAAEKSCADGALSASDLMNFPAVIPAMIMGVIGIQKVPAEMLEPGAMQAALERATALVVRAGIVISMIISILKSKK